MDFSEKTPQELENTIIRGRPESRRSREAVLELIGREQRLQERAIHLLGIEPASSRSVSDPINDNPSSFKRLYASVFPTRQKSIFDSAEEIKYGIFWNILIILAGILLTSSVFIFFESMIPALSIFLSLNLSLIFSLILILDFILILNLILILSLILYTKQSSFSRLQGGFNNKLFFKINLATNAGIVMGALIWALFF